MSQNPITSPSSYGIFIDGENRKAEPLVVSGATPVADANTTPMMSQFLAIKAQHEDAILFYRMGDFYEMFFTDAITASKALGITLTKRGKHGDDDIPMCGVPVHTAEDYLNRLIALGFRVAVCEQMEDPSEAKKRGAKSVVRRDVTRLVTPGTITEETILDPARANILMALGRRKADGADLALAWLDLSTGSVRFTTSSFERLGADLTRIDPRELVVAEPVYADAHLQPFFMTLGPMVSPQPASFFDSANAEKRIGTIYGVTTLDGFGQFSGAELSALSGLFAYLGKTQLAAQPSLSRPMRDLGDAAMLLDPATRANLELTRTLSGARKGSLLDCIDRTVTGGGARLLAERLMSPLTTKDAINERLNSITFFATQTRLSDDLRDMLKSAPDMPRALSRLALERGGPRDLGAMRSGLHNALQCAALFEKSDSLTGLPEELRCSVDALLEVPSDTLNLLNHALSDEMPLQARDGGFIRAGFDARLDELRALRDQSRKVIAKLQGDYAEETGVKSLKIRHNNVLGYFIEVTVNNAAPLITEEAKARFIHRQTLASAMRFTTTELADLESRIANAAGEAQSIELDHFEALRLAVVAIAEPIRQAALGLAILDVAAALAELAQTEGYCRPIIEDGTDFEIIQGRHPIVEQALRRDASGPFVSNDCHLSPDEEHTEPRGLITLLTGPNMGGKSTFLRQNALIALMAQSGSFVPAGSAKIGIVDRLFCRVGASDDLARGRSTFMVEMVETAAILNQATPRSLVILDEIGRGTATYDGLSIAWASVEHLHAVNQCRTLFATHFHELTALAEKLPFLRNATLKVREFDGDVIFLHEITAGTADRSYGVQVARLAGLPSSVIERAKNVLSMLESSGQSDKTAQLIDDLPLFSAHMKTNSHTSKDPKKHNGPSPIEAELAALHLDELTPRDALELLYELKSKIPSQKT